MKKIVGGTSPRLRKQKDFKISAHMRFHFFFLGYTENKRSLNFKIIQ